MSSVNSDSKSNSTSSISGAIPEPNNQKTDNSNNNLEDEKTCSICMDNKKTHAIIMCGHTLCHECGISQEECPFCKKKYGKDDLLKIYI